jgi:hypothetical protein
MMSDRSNNELPDAFLSHSSRDKNLFVRPLAELLTEQGVVIWYDEFSMSPGHSLSASIDSGLSRAKHGIVVISPGFIETARASGWTSYELRGLVANSVGGVTRRIIPIWLDITRDEVRDFSPSLSDLLAIDATSKSIDEVALEILRIIAPERASGLGRFQLLDRLSRRGSKERVDLGSLTPSPALDRRVSGSVPLRALLVTTSLADSGSGAGSDFGTFLENLARDVHHERELRYWEAIAASYTIAKQSFELTTEQLRTVFTLLLSASVGRVDEGAIQTLSAPISESILTHFRSLVDLVNHDVVIGKGGLRWLLGEVDDVDSSLGEQADEATSG